MANIRPYHRTVTGPALNSSGLAVQVIESSNISMLLSFCERKFTQNSENYL